MPRHICDARTTTNPTNCASCCKIIAAVEAKWSHPHAR